MRRNKKKVRWTFFPPNRPTRHLCRGDLEPRGQCTPRQEIKRAKPYGLTLFISLRKMGLEPKNPINIANGYNSVITTDEPSSLILSGFDGSLILKLFIL